MRNTTFILSLAFNCLSLSVVAGDEPAEPKAKKDDERFAALSRLIHKSVVGQMPKVYEDASGWGQTIPIPDKLLRPNLRRTKVKVADHWELPQGTWRKLRIWQDDPSRDLKIHVRDLRRLDNGNYRLELEAGAALRTEADVKQWLNGLLLADVRAQADAQVNLALVFDVAVTLTGKLPPEVKVAPRVTDLKIDLKDFTPRKVTLNRVGITLGGDLVEKAGDDLRGVLQELLRSQAPRIREQANAAIAQALRNGKGTLSAADLFKATAPAKNK
jgi:hypothetical protein